MYKPMNITDYTNRAKAYQDFINKTGNLPGINTDKSLYDWGRLQKKAYLSGYLSKDRAEVLKLYCPGILKYIEKGDHKDLWDTRFNQFINYVYKHYQK